MIKTIKLDYNSTLFNIVNRNESFDMGKLRIAYTGKNRNNSVISKEAFEQAIPTMFNCPIVARYIREDDEIGSHDSEVVKDKSGNSKVVYTTEPVGVIPESAQWHWEVVEDNGEIHEYLCADALLWKRQEAYEKIKSNGITKQSMEINVNEGYMKNGSYIIEDFTFTAFCLLGTAEPCFESASLLMFSNDDEQKMFNQEYQLLLNDYKEMLEEQVEVVAENSKKEVKANLNTEKFKELCALYNVEEDSVEFEYANMSDEELENKFKEVYETVSEEEGEEVEEESIEEPVEEETEDIEEEVEEEFELNSQLKTQIYEAIESLGGVELWEDYVVPKYMLLDFDVEKSEVYMESREDFKLYGCSYTLDGDRVILDAENLKRKKFAIVDFDEGSVVDESVTYSLFTDVTNKIAELTNALQAETEKYSTLEAELETLREFKNEADRKAKEELFSKFEEKLNTMEEFEALKENQDSYTLDELSKELFALVGKISFSLNASNTITINTLENKDQKPNVYGDYLK